MIDALQLITAMLWATVVVVCTAGTWRVVRQRPAGLGDFCLALFSCVGLLHIGYAFRWWLYPPAEALTTEAAVFWACLYGASSLVAIGAHPIIYRLRTLP